MLNLIIGLLLGIAASWFWQQQFSGAPAFRQLMQKELALNGQLGSISVLKKRLEIMEKRLAELERKPEPCLPVELSAGRDADTIRINEKSSNQAASLSVVTGAKKADPEESGAERKKARNRVLALWKEGQTVAEIASRTGLGKGETELIIALKDKSGAG